MSTVKSNTELIKINCEIEKISSLSGQFEVALVWHADKTNSMDKNI